MNDFFIVKIDEWACDLYGPYPTAELAHVDADLLSKALDSMSPGSSRQVLVIESSHPRDLARRLSVYWDGLDE